MNGRTFLAVAVLLCAFMPACSAVSASSESSFVEPPSSQAGAAGYFSHTEPSSIQIPSVVEDTFDYEIFCDYDGDDVMGLSIFYSQPGTGEVWASMYEEPQVADGRYGAILELRPIPGKLTYHFILETTASPSEELRFPVSGDYETTVVDLFPPEVSRDAISYGVGSEVRIYYYIRDNVNTTEASLTYKFPGQESYKTIALRYIGYEAWGVLFSPWLWNGTIECRVTASDGTNEVVFPATGYDKWHNLDQEAPNMRDDINSTLFSPIYRIEYEYSSNGVAKTGRPHDVHAAASVGEEINFTIAFDEYSYSAHATLYYWTNGEEVLANSVALDVEYLGNFTHTFVMRGTIPAIGTVTTLSFSVRSWDDSGNEHYFRYQDFNISVEDMTPPVIEQVFGTEKDIAKNGTIKARVSDNYCVSQVLLYIDDDLNDDTNPYMYTMNNDGGGIYSFPVPEMFLDAEFHFCVKASDGTNMTTWPMANGTESYQRVAKIGTADDGGWFSDLLEGARHPDSAGDYLTLVVILACVVAVIGAVVYGIYTMVIKSEGGDGGNESE